MRDFFFIFIFFVLGFTFSAHAQVTAVMQAKVVVISGSKASAVQQGAIDISKIGIAERVNTGGITIQTAPESEVIINVYDKSGIINKRGESLNFELLSADQISSVNGKHEFEINGFLKDLPQSKSSYSGKMIAVIEYL